MLLHSKVKSTSVVTTILSDGIVHVLLEVDGKDTVTVEDVDGILQDDEDIEGKLQDADNEGKLHDEDVDDDDVTDGNDMVTVDDVDGSMHDPVDVDSQLESP